MISKKDVPFVLERKCYIANQFMPMEQLIKSFDYKIYTKVEGTGSPLLLLHSLWGSQILFDKIVKPLAEKYKIIRIDFPGHGSSASPLKNFTFEQFADVLDDVLIQIGIEEKINLLGHSMGGFAALAFAKKYPQKIASLILIHSLLKNADLKSIRLRNRQVSLIENNKKDLLLQVTISSNFAPGNVDRFTAEFEQLVLTANLVTDQGAIAGINAINSRENSLPFMMETEIPTFMVVGVQDRVYNPEDQLSEYSNLPHAELLLLHNSGHLGFIEEEAFFVSGVSHFLDSVRSE